MDRGSSICGLIIIGNRKRGVSSVPTTEVCHTLFRSLNKSSPYTIPETSSDSREI